MIENEKLYFLLLVCFYGGVSYGKDLVLDTAVKSRQLANGLCYYIRQNNSLCRFSPHTVCWFGSGREAGKEDGLFLKHMDFNGTKHFPGNTLVSTLEK
ncbi:hypothetical protein [Sphingobacterium sp. UBA6320]|jgi:zinc protease|uniref:hypothetical protein n=1 Tax=Sphingobacterium sp. UBA6320 TaxID=1947510 RepID=UPI0025F62787|nr:hypothetical protein [Sphingobacterium sp. UBA6320]